MISTGYTSQRLSFLMSLKVRKLAFKIVLLKMPREVTYLLNSQISCYKLYLTCCATNIST
jgi:hypothetical protein